MASQGRRALVRSQSGIERAPLEGTLGARVRGSARGRGRASARPAPLLRVKHPQSSAGNARTGALAGVAWGPRIVMRITSSAHTSKIAATRNEVAMPCVST
jgi:hypothetical protein